MVGGKDRERRRRDFGARKIRTSAQVGAALTEPAGGKNERIAGGTAPRSAKSARSDGNGKESEERRGSREAAKTADGDRGLRGTVELAASRFEQRGARASVKSVDAVYGRHGAARLYTAAFYRGWQGQRDVESVVYVAASYHRWQSQSAVRRRQLRKGSSHVPV